MARIVFEARMVTPRMHGISRYAFELLRQLLRLDPDNQYVVLRSGPFLEEQLQRERLVTLDPRLPLYGVRELFAMPRLLRRLDADLYYSPTYFAPPLSPFCPQIQTIHDLTQLWRGHRTWRYRAYYDLVLARAVHRSSVVVTETQFVARQIARRFRLPDSRIAVVPSGVGLEQPPAAGPRRDEVLCLVNDKPHKNAAGAVRAVERLRASGRPARLVLVGALPAALEGPVAARPWIEHHPFLEQTELVRRYGCACALLFPSFSEGFGYPPLEAMLAGTPVVSSDASCMPEVLGDAALYADPRSPEQMARQLARVFDSPELAAELAERGWLQARRYSWEAMGRQVLGLIRGALVR